MKNKKTFISFLVIFSIVGILLCLSFILNYNIKKDITLLKEKITNSSQSSIENINNQNNLKSEYDKLNKELEDKIKEYEVWVKMKEKLTK